MLETFIASFKFGLFSGFTRTLAWSPGFKVLPESSPFIYAECKHRAFFVPNRRQENRRK